MTARHHSVADRKHPDDAFTLAESLFAMAIVSFVLLTIIGVMPSGLSALKDAETRAAESRICQTMLADYEGRTWANLATQPDVVTYFDDQGIATSTDPSGSSSTKGATFAAHAALIVNPQAGALAMVSSGLLPGDASPNPFIRYVRIAVSSNALNQDTLAQLQSAVQQGRNAPFIHVYTFLLANLEPALP